MCNYKYKPPIYIVEGITVFKSKSVSLHGKLNDHKKNAEVFTALCIG